MSGREGDLSERQHDKLNKFKDILRDILKPEHDDYCLLRFLRARNFDLKKSEDMFRTDVEWRVKNKMEALANDFKVPKVCEKYWAGGILEGYDKEECPIWILPIGNFDPKGLLYSCKTRDLITNVLVMIDKMFRENETRCKQLGKRIDWGVTVIIDAEGIGLRHLWTPFVDIVTEILTTTEQHYPETSKRIFIVKAPSIFPMAFSLCKPFLKEHTREKIKVLGSHWKDVLLQYIDADVLPVFWGGSKTDPNGDIKCPSRIKPGGEVPENLYKTDVNFDGKEFTIKDISRGSKLEISCETNQDSSLLRYLFRSHDHDIGFGLSYVEHAGNKTSILDTKRYNCHMVPEDGEVLLDKAGKYVLTFDNSYSWTRSKKISYWFETLEPFSEVDEDEDETNFLDAVINDNDT